MKEIRYKELLISLAISLGAGVLGALFSADSMGQYENMFKPFLAPPSWVFPVVWTILYILMGISTYFVLISENENKKLALTFYGIQLVLNILWPFLFFNLHLYFVAFVWLVIMWYFVYSTIVEYKEIDRRAAWLLIPYLVWVTFAGYLNLAIAIGSK